MTYSKTTWTNSSGQPISASNLNKMETGIADAQPESSGVYNVKHYGALGTGSGGASADQAGFVAAFAACGRKGIVYIPPGDYYVSGGFTQGLGCQVVGAGQEASQINHTGNNICFAAHAVSSGADVFAERGWRGFKLLGNSGASARGIVHGNSYGATFQDLRVGEYTAGTAIELRNSLYYTEGTRFDNVHTRNSLRGLEFTRSGTGTDSFSNTSMSNVHLQAAASGQTAMYVGDDTMIYYSLLEIKLMVEVAGAVGMRLGALSRLGYYNPSSTLYPNLYQIGFELPAKPTTAKGIVADASAALRGNGTIDPPLSNDYHTIPAGTNIYVGQTDGIPATYAGKSAGSVANYRGGGNAADLYSVIQEDKDTNLAGFGVARGSNILGPIAYMYQTNLSAFDLRSLAVGQTPATGTSVFSVDGTGHIQSGGLGTPGIAAGAAAGTSPTVSVTGNDTTGYITITTGTSPPTTADATVATVTFNGAYRAAPRVLLTPANGNAGALSTNRPYVDRSAITTTQFLMKKPSATALTASTAYEFFYQVMQ